MEFSDNFSESSTPVSFTVGALIFPVPLLFGVFFFSHLTATETQCINEGNSLLQIHFEASEPPQQEWFDYSVLFARDCPWPSKSESFFP
jgi:hypothetical protein